MLSMNIFYVMPVNARISSESTTFPYDSTAPTSLII